MRAHRLTVVALAILAATPLAASASGGAAVAPSGFRGVVMRGPTTPVCRVGVPCTVPAANFSLVFSRAGRAPVRVRTDAEGRYRIEFPAGVYTVGAGAAAGRLPQRPTPHRVKVRPAHIDRLDFFVDTGIR